MRTRRLPFALTPLLLLASCSGNTPTTSGSSGSGGGAATVAGGGGTAPVATGGATAAAGSAGVPNGTGGSSAGSAGALSSGGTGTGTAGAPPSGGAGGMSASGSGGGAGSPGLATCPYTAPTVPTPFPQNWTAAKVTQFNANGGWTWYNDERVVVDAAAGKIVVSSAASSASSQTQNTSIDVVIHDLATGQNTKKSLGTLSYSDDHNNGAIVVKAPGEYFVAYAHHNVDCNTYWANYAGGAWAATAIYGWGTHGCTTNPKKNAVTYNNIWRMSSEAGALYNFVRSVDTSPSFLHSTDNGATWKLAGRLTGSPQVGYNAGYYKYWGNGVDRIDFFATESHPRDSNTSVYHGYVQGKKSYTSAGVLVDDNIFDTAATTGAVVPEITKFTKVFSAGDMLGGVPLRRLWNFDVARYEDGTVGVLWQGREKECSDKLNCTPGHHVAYSRFDGTTWKSTRLVKGGRTLYRDKTDWWEEDYLGGAALDPDDPHAVYVSTNIDPRDDKTEYPVNEIWKGVSCDNGATFTWTPITMNSEKENLRPVVPKWDVKNKALLWFRGTYNTAQMYSAEVVGIIDRK
ncbi:MAG TPA: BNR-4 repeat-containing protein [Polyangiaceae bacterium]|nr:BNR-4 repeat-containing protein [Polyangiaceae bacterium]